MNLHLASVGLAAALHVGFAWPQPLPASPHQGHHPEQKAPEMPAPSARQPLPSAPQPLPSSGYRSSFADYRPFAPDEPMKDWRAANEAVREAGGHAGLMKAAAPKPAKAPKP